MWEMRPLVTSRLLGTMSRMRPTTLAPSSTSASVSQLPRSPLHPVTRTGRSRQSVSLYGRFTVDLPHFPGRPLRGPVMVQGIEVTESIHALPVAVVLIDGELALLGQ